MGTVDFFDHTLSVIDENTREFDKFLSVQDKVASVLKKSIKSCYDFIKERSLRRTKALPQLVIDGFDEEQIWQQLELQNEEELTHMAIKVSQILASVGPLHLPLVLNKKKILEKKLNPKSKEDAIEISTEPETPDISNTILKPNRINERKRKIHTSIVDDKFFKLQELKEYLTKVETKATKVDKNESDNESVDLFYDSSDHEEKNARDPKFSKYADFFDNPESEEEDVGIGDQQSTKEDETELQDDDGHEDEIEMPVVPSKKVKFNLTNDSDDTDSLENKKNTNQVQNEFEQNKSTFEVRQERLKAKIREIEDTALSEKPWQLKGEINATNRPQNSLLEEFVEFDITSRPPPVMTELVTVRLEDIIIRRIKDKVWDDVEKKFKPVETPVEYKKKLILDQEKSKQSLSQIYENEYLKQKQQVGNSEGQEIEEEEPKSHVEIREKMHLLFAKLDALSNFHFTPKLAKPEIKIISNIPAIDMEEVAPVATADSALLAPEEIKTKARGDRIGKSERTKTDMKRERRKKKIRQREKGKAKEKSEKIVKLSHGSNIKSKANRLTK